MKKIEELSDWRDGLNTVLHGDCLDLMRMMPDKCIDLVLTDPPYGIGSVWKGGRGHGWGNAQNQAAARNEWDSETPSSALFDEIIRISKQQIIWGGNYFELPVSRCWLIWNKPERGFSLSEAELAWTSFDNVMRVFDHRRSDTNRKHPTQKPLELGRWCLENYGKGCKTIFDPFAGSFTFARAAKDMGFDFLACDREEDYCRIGEERLRQECLF